MDTPCPDPPGPAAQHLAAEHLAAIAARLTARGLIPRLTRLGATPVLTIDQPAAGPDPVTITIDPCPGPGAGPGMPLDCTCLWTPAPGTAPETTADTIITILTALRPATSQHEPQPTAARTPG